MTEKFLITAGQGFLGAWVARSLLEEGTPFVLFDRRPHNGILLQVIEPERLSGIERAFGPPGEARALERAIRDRGVTRVIHLAGLEEAAAGTDQRAAARERARAMESLFQAVRGAGPELALTVYAAEEGSPEEEAARIAHRTAGIPSVGLRPATLYGAGHERGPRSSPTRAIKAAVLERRFRIDLAGKAGFTYAADAARALVSAARSEPRGAVSFPIPAEEIPLERFIEEIHRAIPAAKGKISGAAGEGPTPFELEDLEVAEPLLEEFLGENLPPATPLAEGIRRTAEIFRGLAGEGRLHDRDLV